MSNDNSDSVPSFRSTLPPELLKGQDEHRQYLYTKLDEIGQAQKWLIDKSVEHRQILEEVKAQTIKTNGRVTASENKLVALEADQGLQLARVGASLVRSKVFWGITIVFVLVVMPWVTVHAQSVLELVKSIASIFAG